MVFKLQMQWLLRLHIAAMGGIRTITLGSGVDI